MRGFMSGRRGFDAESTSHLFLSQSETSSALCIFGSEHCITYGWFGAA